MVQRQRRRRGIKMVYLEEVLDSKQRIRRTEDAPSEAGSLSTCSICNKPVKHLVRIRAVTKEAAFVRWTDAGQNGAFQDPRS